MAEIKNYTLNFGPQHPAAHGVLRLVLELDGEGRITLATDAIRFDGAPGCHRTWGTDVQR